MGTAAAQGGTVLMGGALTCEMNTLGFNPAPLLPDLMPWDSQPAQASISPSVKCAQNVPLVQGDSEAFVPLQPEMAPSQGFPNRKALVSGQIGRASTGSGKNGSGKTGSF